MSFSNQLRRLEQPANISLLLEIKRGLEKENLRVTPEGYLSEKKHLSELGSALTHPSITTDFSEALLEFITRPSNSIDQVLEELEEIQRYTYTRLSDELLWVSSMPCVIDDDSQIPIAHFGDSNVGQMKHIYRVGLGNRYGRSMQVIAGIHYNFSVSDRFWRHLMTTCNSTIDIDAFRTSGYLSLIRNFRRQSWLLLYLLGASPAASHSFTNQLTPKLSHFNSDQETLYSQFGTSLRMGDLGYQSAAQAALSVKYNYLDEYITDLRRGLDRVYFPYEKIGKKDPNSKYLQLNTHLLQIENEFYSVIRPKCVSQSGEPPLHALKDRGIQYVEIRCLDLNPFLPNGIDKQTIHFLDVFLLYCLLSDSPYSSIEEQSDIAFNHDATVYRGRDSSLCLRKENLRLTISDWGQQILEQIKPIANLMDRAHQSTDYAKAINEMESRILDSSKTPSAMILEQLRSNNESHQEFGIRMAKEHTDYFLKQKLDEGTIEKYSKLAQNSIAEQLNIEKHDILTFDQYLSQYYDQ